MDCLAHLGCQLHFGASRHREHIAVKVDITPLAFGLWEHFSYGLQHTRALVADNEFQSVQAAPAEPLKKADPAGLVLFHALSRPQNLAVSVFIDHNCYQNGYVFKLSAPVAAQIDPIHVDVRIPSTLQRAIAPILNVDIRLFVQFADGGGGLFASPQGLRNILHTPHGHACQIHLHESFFHAALPAAIPLNDSSFK